LFIIIWHISAAFSAYVFCFLTDAHHDAVDL